MISGEAAKLDVSSEEFKFANRSFISRHPAATKWIETHSFYLCKLEIEQIVVLDWYGGPHYVKAEDYYRANPASSGFLYNESSTKAEEDRTISSNDIGSVNEKSGNSESVTIHIQRGGDASVTIEL